MGIVPFKSYPEFRPFEVALLLGPPGRDDEHDDFHLRKFLNPGKPDLMNPGPRVLLLPGIDRPDSNT